MRLITPVILGVAGLIAGAAIQCLPAAAGIRCDPSGGLTTDQTSADGGLTCPTVPGEKDGGDEGRNGKSVSRGRPACVWVPKPDYQPSPGEPAEGQGGHWYQKFCAFGQYKTIADLQRALGDIRVSDMRQNGLIRRAGLDIQFFKTPPEIPRRTPLQVMQSVVGSLPFAKPYLAVNPIATRQVIGVPTWVWLTDDKGRYVPGRYEQKSKTIFLEGYALQWRIVPQISLTPGDGGPAQPCQGAGIPWSTATANDPAACTVTYQHSGSYALTASVGWTVQWWLANTRQQDLTGPTNTTTHQLTISEIQTITR
ncbi:hypothetical protein [Kribbella solani]|uniref:PKD domain-containing protein n=3 Tax=Kribbella solani TaxID=236067 RepID=A0A841DTB0_9ACTN|nr:hypothetical protein [Kribbella solani]MBB5979986.1 hypothetical protein [Kribbella solani]